MAVSATKYVVPRDDNTFLVSPQSHDWGDILQRNAERTAAYPDWIQSLRRKARSEAIESAGMNAACSQPLVIGGHQPELFHPGVWFKNFFLNRLVRDLQCSPLHIQIDHDVVRDIELAVPIIRSGQLALTTKRLPTSQDGKFIPWENTRCSDLLIHDWRQCVDQISSHLRQFGIESLIGSRWGDLERLLKQCNSFAQVTSQFRQIIEMDAGLVNNEVPMSHLAKGEAFAEFVFRCFHEAETLLEVYNVSRDTFRAERGITNPGQPVPELRQGGDWIETPFWIYHTPEAADSLGMNSHFRQPAWIRLTTNEIELASAPNQSAAIQLRCNRNLSDWSHQYQSWTELGVCIRPRALMTTLFLRLFVGDLFVHGIGGGIYDELTDLIAKQLWDIEMPAYIVASASLHLPFGHDVLASVQGVEGQSITDLAQRARQIRSAPESLLDLADRDQRAQKEAFDELLRRIPPRGQKKSWHGEMRELRVRIRKSISGTIKQLERQSLELIERTRVSKIVRSREFSFALFPEISTTARLRTLAERSVCTECSTYESSTKLKDGETSTLAAEEC
ncbi:MAG: hypothetical protein MUC43_13960 [Pirellula sp.]|jgi:hypothetical protein|nr:hypothetical protein [Pirellula sp.]